MRVHPTLGRIGPLACGLVLALTFVTGAAQAQSYRLMLQTRADSARPAEVFVANYGSYADFVASPAAVNGDFWGIDIGSQYQVSGLAYDGQYRLLLSTRNDGGPPGEVFVATYASYADLIASPAAVGGDFSGIDIGSSYEVVAFAYDGRYRLVLQTRTDSGPPAKCSSPAMTALPTSSLLRQRWAATSRASMSAQTTRSPASHTTASTGFC
jgi:hypothetical protein